MGVKMNSDYRPVAAGEVIENSIVWAAAVPPKPDLPPKRPIKTPFRRGLFSRITLRVGAPVAVADATPERLQATVLALCGDCR